MKKLLAAALVALALVALGATALAGPGGVDAMRVRTSAR